MLSDSNKNKKITEFEDIVEELSKEKGIPYEEMKEICALSLNYIKTLTEDKNTLSILVPHLGTLYYSERLGEFYKFRFGNFEKGNSEFKKNTYNFLDHRTKLIEKNEEKYDVKKSYHRRKPFLYKFKNIFKKIFGRPPKGGATIGYQELWTKFSEIQNKKQNDEG